MSLPEEVLCLSGGAIPNPGLVLCNRSQYLATPSPLSMISDWQSPAHRFNCSLPGVFHAWKSSHFKDRTFA